MSSKFDKGQIICRMYEIHETCLGGFEAMAFIPPNQAY